MQSLGLCGAGPGGNEQPSLSGSYLLEWGLSSAAVSRQPFNEALGLSTSNSLRKMLEVENRTLECEPCTGPRLQCDLGETGSLCGLGKGA